MARKLNKILADIDAGKSPKVDQEVLLGELSEAIENIATGKAPKPTAQSTIDGMTDFKYLTTNDKLAYAAAALKTVRLSSIEIAKSVDGILVNPQSTSEQDGLIDSQSVALISKDPVLRNLTLTSGSSLF